METTTTSPSAPSGRAPTFLMCALYAIYFDETANVRGDWEYDTAPNAKFKAQTGDGKAGLFEDIEQNGINTPLWVDTLSASERKEIHARTGVSYDYVCLRGHRRGRVLKQLAAKYPGRFDTIPCQVYHGLSESERVMLKVDQTHVKGLSDWGLYLAIRQLAMQRLTEPQIAVKIGMSRGFVQAKLRIARLPRVVEEEYRKKCKGEPAVNLTDKNLNALMMAQKADTDKGIADTDGTGTPAFKTEWASIVETGQKSATTPTAMSRKDLDTVIGMCKDSLIADTLRYAAGYPVQLPAILASMEALRTQAEAYAVMVATEPATSPVPATAEPATPEPAPAEPATVPAEPATPSTVTVPAEPVGARRGNGPRRGNGARR